MLYCHYLIYRTVNCNYAKVHYRAPLINGVLVTYSYCLTVMKCVFVYRYRSIVSVHNNFILRITNEMLFLKIMWHVFMGPR
jgi:hypothetical protein